MLDLTAQESGGLDQLGLDQLGLDQSVQLVYVAIIGDPRCTVSSLAESLGLSEPEVRLSLDRLSELALVSWGDDAHSIRPVDPATGLRALLTRQQAEVVDSQRRLQESQLAVERWLSAHRTIRDRSETVRVERIDGVDAVRRRLTELAEHATESIWSFNPGGAQTQANLVASRPLNESTLARGISMRAIYLDSVRNHEPTSLHARWLTELGGEVRTIPMLPMRMLVVDRRLAVVPLDELNTADGALLVSGQGLVAGLTALFMTTWRLATPFGASRGRRTGLLNAQEQQALELWAQGHTDAAVATRLGVSERTVRRISETVSDRLGARSRFEAGARAVELGLIRSSDLP